jgi:hypothetical protein
MWLVLVMAVSVSPLSFKLKLHTIGVYHDIGHYAVYTLTGILLWIVVKHWYWRIPTFAGGLGLAFGQEWLENRLYHAGFEWKDVGTDLAGLVTGFALMLLVVALMEDPARQRD